MSAESIKNPSTVHNSFAPKKIDGCPIPKLNLRKCFFYSWNFSKFIYFLQTRYIVRKIKHRFNTRQLFVQDSKVN